MLVKKQIALAKTELKSDARTEAKVAGGLGLAAVGAIITLTLLLVTGAFALALVLPGVSWSRRIRQPLQRSRDELKQDVRFTKERFA